ncbi:hypothetical protein ACPCG0_07440 [Propionibacteriaceae bacterium Y1923]
MTPVDMLALVVGAVIVPVLTAVITRPDMSSNAKRVVVLVTSVVLGGL